MKWFVVLMVASLARFSEGGALRCAAGSEKSTCIEDTEETIAAPLEAPAAPTGKECAAGTFWSSQCNECGCSPSGYSFCTEKACAGQRAEPQFRCAPESQWKNDCNTCRCTGDGQPTCTEMLCNTDRITDVIVPESNAQSHDSEALDLETDSYQKHYFVVPAPTVQEQDHGLQKIDLNAGEYDPNLENIYFTKEDNDVNQVNSYFGLSTENIASEKLPEYDANEYIHNIEDLEYDPPMIKLSGQDLIKEEDNQNTAIHEEIPLDIAQGSSQNKYDSSDHRFSAKLELGTQQDLDVDPKMIGKPEYTEGNMYKREEHHDNEKSDDTKHFRDNVLSHSDKDNGMKKTLKVEEFNKDILEQDTLDHNDGKREAYNIHDLMKQDFAKKPLVKRSVCKPNQQFQSECNSCKCAPDGLSYTCTHNECMEGETNKEVEVFMESEGVDHIERHSVCKATATFYIGCNTCHCNYFGTDYSCTNKPCPLPEDVELFHELKAANINKSSKNTTQKIVCVANRMFIMNCNTCWCNEDGTSYFCTRKVCTSDLTEEDLKKQLDVLEASNESSKNVSQKIICVANRMFRKDCNTCWCNADGTSFSCTRKFCIPQEGEKKVESEQSLRLIKKECKPDEVFVIDCNMCRCNPDGLSYSCTRRACVSQIDEEERKNISQVRRIRGITQEPPKTCVPGQHFRLDCNTCLCDNEGQDFSCTRNDCSAVNGNGASVKVKREALAEEVAMECSAGSVFDQDCNVCRCTDGHHAMCTVKRCIKPGTVSVTTEVTPLSGLNPDFRCNPGEQFKRNCNDCSCSADGKSVFCTVRFCDQDVTPPSST